MLAPGLSGRPHACTARCKMLQLGFVRKIINPKDPKTPQTPNGGPPMGPPILQKHAVARALADEPAREAQKKENIRQSELQAEKRNKR